MKKKTFVAISIYTQLNEQNVSNLYKYIPTNSNDMTRNEKNWLEFNLVCMHREMQVVVI